MWFFEFSASLHSSFFSLQLYVPVLQEMCEKRNKFLTCIHFKDAGSEPSSEVHVQCLYSYSVTIDNILL